MDLFNPSFLMYLGILVLAVSLVVVYFESRIREQNHKMTSMLGIISVLADETRANHNSILERIEGSNQVLSRVPFSSYENQKVGGDLIEVSEDEDEDESSDEEESEKSGDEDLMELTEIIDDDDEHDDEHDDEDEDDEDEDDDENEEDDEDKIEDNESSDEASIQNNVKILKLDMQREDPVFTSDVDIDVDDLEILESELDVVDELPELTESYVEKVLDLKYDDIEEQKESVLKTISIDLGSHSEEQIDYKKLQIQKLRSIVVEKGLKNNEDVSKLKKPELLKLLGSE